MSEENNNVASDNRNDHKNDNSSAETSELKNIIEAALFAAAQPIGIRKIQSLFAEDAKPSKQQIDEIVAILIEEYQNKGLELVRIGSGWRFQTVEKYAPWMRKLSAEKMPRYSRAQLETLAIIAYRQPVTRGDIEQVRGVAVSSDIIRVLEDRGWIREIGHRDVPGRPALFGTTQEFLSYFNLRNLSDLPELIHERQFEEIAKEMNMNLPLELDNSEEHASVEESVVKDAIEEEKDADENRVNNSESVNTAKVISISQAVENRLAAENASLGNDALDDDLSDSDSDSEQE